MKFNLKSGLMLLACSLFLGTAASCGQKEINTPEDAIVDAFGDRQFRISFDSSNLDKPISDMYYSAKNMPKLPTPTKVGYLFEGWYFDTSYNELCNVEDGSLFWKMKNVTLYAKWKVEEIVNNGQYDIEYEAKIVDGSLRTGPLCKELGYYKFNEDIIENTTYIEKNQKGTFLRIQYDCRTKGPVLGGEGSDENNFSKLTYTITDDNNRIDEGLSILDRTSTIQTIYYNIDGLLLSDPIILHVEYYNWKDKLEEKQRKQASAFYDISFEITRFIGFGASFVDNNARLEDGIYTIPTHYAELSKEPSILDAFNPVTSYIVASKGNYKLYKPLSIYSSDFPHLTEQQFPLRTTGFAKEFTYFLVDQKLVANEEQIANKNGDYFIPELLKAKQFETINLEFFKETGEYYYSLNLGDTLDKDIVFFGGSCGAMEQMFSFATSYRRLILDYSSMIRISGWDYEPLSGSYYSFKKDVTFYPGSPLDFANNNSDFDTYLKYKSSIIYPNIFYSNTPNGIKVYDSKIVIEPKSKYPYLKDSRYSYQYFTMTMQVYGYDPEIDGELYSRDYIFTTAGENCYSNSEINKNENGKTLNKGDDINLNSIYREKVSLEKEPYTYKAYKLKNDLTINYDEEVKIDYNFKFKENIAVVFTCDLKGFERKSTVKLVEKQEAKIILNKQFTLDDNGVYTTDERYKLGQEIIAPEIQYSYYNEGFTTKNLHKDDDVINDLSTDFTRVSFWYYKDGVYKSHPYFPGDFVGYDLIMDAEKIRFLYQLDNQFDEFETKILEISGIDSGTYQIKNGDVTLQMGDLFYENNRRVPIQYEMRNCLTLDDRESTLNLPENLTLEILDNDIKSITEMPLEFGIIYLKTATKKIHSVNEIWDLIKDEPYALIYLYLNSNYGDQVVVKAEFNFIINGKGLDKYNIYDKSKTYFKGQEVKLDEPIITNSDFVKFSQGYLRVYKKVGNNFIDSNETCSYSANRVNFFQVGTYLITWNFRFQVDYEGNKIFESYTGESFTEQEISLSEEIEVVNPQTKVKLTYVTDMNHQFNKESSELKGFTIYSKDDYQYAEKYIDTNDPTYALSSESFLPSNDKLYRYSDEKGNYIGVQYNLLKDVHIKLSTLEPTLYACWDSGIKIGIYYDVYGEVTFARFTDLLFKNTRSGANEYVLTIGDCYFDRPKGYALYGWKADDQIFYEKVLINGHQTDVKTNFHKGELPQTMKIYNQTNLTAIMKKKTILNYNAYDEVGNKLKFMKFIDGDYNVFINDKLSDSINKNKYNDLLNVHVTDTEKELLYWEVYNYKTNQFDKVKIENFILLDEYQLNGKIELRAIFG